MRLLVEATPLALRRYPRAGVHRYGTELLRRLSELLPQDWEMRLAFHFFRKQHLAGVAEVLRSTGVGEHHTCRVHPLLLRSLRVPAEWTAGAHDLIHGPFDYLPPSRRSTRVLTVHDLAFLRSPEGLPESWVRHLRRSVPVSVRRAHLLLTGSEFSKRDLVERFQVDPQRIRVFRHGVRPGLAPPADPEEAAARIRDRYGLERGYLLYLGTLQPNKNLEALCAAFQLLRGRGEARKLVLAGTEGWLFDEMWGRIVGRGLDADVERIGFVTEDDLAALYACADVFVLVSVLEGFGIPVLEAMACGTPVVVADACSLPEVAGEAGVTTDPTEPEAIAAAIRGLLDDPQERERRRAQGLVRAAGFTWEACAAAHLAAYQEALAIRSAA